MPPWQVLQLKEFQAELAALQKAHGFDAAKLDAAVDAEFIDPFKAERLDKLLRQGASSGVVVRLEGSAYPPSLRVHILHDLRITAWLFPEERHAVLVHAFHKSSDPNYARALKIHDRRLEKYFASLQSFVDKKRR